jgi:hypothetical protein
MPGIRNSDIVGVNRSYPPTRPITTTTKHYLRITSKEVSKETWS